MVQRSYSSSFLHTNNSVSRSSSSSFVVAAPVTLARSPTTVFSHSPRGYLPPDRYIRPSYGLGKPPGVVGRTPFFMDRYPYVQYSTFSSGPYAGRGNLAETTAAKFWPGKINCYNSSLSAPTRIDSRLRPKLYSHESNDNRSNISKYSTRMGVDDAINMYRKRYLTVGQLSKYWLTPKTAEYKSFKGGLSSPSSLLYRYSSDNKYRFSSIY